MVPEVAGVRRAPAGEVQVMTGEPTRPLVLVVEDDRDTREMYAMFLDFSGVAVLTAASADTAHAMAVEHQPNIVVTDMMLEGSGTGADLCLRLQADERTAHIPALLVTGFSQHQAGPLQEWACAEVRTKPYLPDAMVQDIKKILARPADRRAG